MTTTRRDKGSERREIEKIAVREVMNQDVEREEMPPGCRHVSKASDLDELDRIIVY